MALTTNRSFDIPARGGSVGTWDTELRNNASNLDTMLGGVLTTSVSSSPVNLASTAYNYGVLKFTGAISANIIITLPAKACFYIIDNQTTGTSYYLQLTTGSGEVVAVPQGRKTTVAVDATNVAVVDAPEPGTFWDWGGATAPAWIAACTVRPWLVCDGSTYNIADYPHLAAILGSTWGGNGVTTFGVPDLRNRVRVPLKASSPLLTSAVSDIDGTVRGTGGATNTESKTLATANLPPYTPAGTVSVTLAANEYIRPEVVGNFVAGSTIKVGLNTSTPTVTSSTFTGTAQGGTSTPFSRVQPTLVHGMTFIHT